MASRLPRVKGHGSHAACRLSSPLQSHLASLDLDSSGSKDKGKDEPQSVPRAEETSLRKGAPTGPVRNLAPTSGPQQRAEHLVFILKRESAVGWFDKTVTKPVMVFPH